MSSKPIRALIVDDSVFMRTMLKTALSKCAQVEIIGTAQNGQEALEKLDALKPDVMTLDIEMPGLDGLGVLERIMKTNPLPVVMVSTKTQEGAELTFKALDLGAVDYVAKPLADKSTSMEAFQEKVVKAVLGAASANKSHLAGHTKLRVLKPRTASLTTEGTIVAIGISAGGPATLHKLMPMIPENFPPIVITQHMPADFTGPFAKRLDASSKLAVKQAESGEELQPGQALLAQGDRHLRVRKVGRSYRAYLDDGPKVAGFRPSVDVLFESVAKTFGPKAIGLIMTGMGCDGSNGVRLLKKVGARTLAQDQESSIVYGMPKAAFETGCIDTVVSLPEIPDLLVRLLSTPEPAVT